MSVTFDERVVESEMDTEGVILKEEMADVAPCDNTRKSPSMGRATTQVSKRVIGCGELIGH